MQYKIIGIRNGKKYVSKKKFITEKSALNYAYKNLVYNPSGDTKRKQGLRNFRIARA